MLTHTLKSSVPLSSGEGLGVRSESGKLISHIKIPLNEFCFEDLTPVLYHRTRHQNLTPALSRGEGDARLKLCVYFKIHVFAFLNCFYVILTRVG